MLHPKPNAFPHVEVLVLRKNLLFSILAQFHQPMLYLRAHPYLSDDPSTMCSASYLNCSYRKSSQWETIDPEGMVHCKLA
ncbi:hypothetical protein ALC56_12073 [Trachymyrmex septentrionalis]|uniref:Uncharacterized protein n=1 Tax=Trachymyrmex septentrionalis TaxID=34720 RepID=A0A195EZM4_9HYME|nr:hypothetical protein ALC56_12073 [Trachymyrmex septentrionalis]